MTATRSATAKASSWSWVTNTAVVPVATSAARRSTARRSRRRAVEGGQGLVEKQEPGRGGERAGQGDALALAAGQGRDAAVLVAGQADQLEQRATRAPERGGQAVGRRCPPTVRCAKSCPSWNISPNPRRCTGTPASETPSHDDGARRRAAPGPATARSSDDLPQPDGPSSATTDPGATSRETPSTAVGGAVPDDDVAAGTDRSPLTSRAGGAQSFAGGDDPRGEHREDDGRGERHAVGLGDRAGR